MIALVLAFEEPEDEAEIDDLVRDIVITAKEKVGDRPNLKGYIASHAVADAVVDLFKKVE